MASLIFKESIREDAEAQQRIRVWIEDLRSGNREQTNGWLHRQDDGFCCLGVLLDEIDSAAWTVEFGHDRVMIWRAGTADAEAATLPESVWKSLHMHSDGGAFWSEEEPLEEFSDEFFDGLHLPPGEFSLASMNDAGKSFAEIADVLEYALNKVLA